MKVNLINIGLFALILYVGASDIPANGEIQDLVPDPNKKIRSEEDYKKTPEGFSDFGPKTAGEFVPFENSRLGICFAYPSHWIIQYETGTHQKYDKIRIIGTRNEDRTYSNCFVVVKEALKTDESLSTLIAEKIKHIGKIEKGVLLGESIVKIGQRDEAKKLSFQYQLNLPPRAFPGISTTIREDRYYLVKDQILFQFILYADARNYNDVKDIFDHFLSTVELLK